MKLSAALLPRDPSQQVPVAVERVLVAVGPAVRLLGAQRVHLLADEGGLLVQLGVGEAREQFVCQAGLSSEVVDRFGGHGVKDITSYA
jgi:hypothetical protein